MGKNNGRKFETGGGDKSTGLDWSILERYDEDERRRVADIKDELRQDELKYNSFADEIGGLSYRERAEEVSEPRTWRKLGRLALDVVNLHPRVSEKRRQQEAFAIAKKEIEAERAERDFQYRLESLMSQTGDSVRQIMWEEEREKRERECLEREMADGMDVQRHHKQEYYENERKQELLERDLNEKLVTVDELEEQVNADNPEVEKRYMEYGEEEVPVYDLRGLPFAMLSHSIEYRKINYNNDFHMGVQTSKQLVENPEIWKQRDDEFEMVGSGGQARGDVISASYINSEHNLNTRSYETKREPDICYGFEQVEGDAILASGTGDMGSNNGFGKMRGTTGRLVDWKVLESMSTGWDGYNEVVLRRYDETGKPRLPDYIIAQNGRITEGMLKHATAFDIPILNIEEKYYNEKFRERAEGILADVNEEDSYEKILTAFHEIGSFSPYRSTMRHINSAQGTLNQDLDELRRSLQSEAHDDFDRKLLWLGDLELEKRIPFIAETLSNEIEVLKQMNRNEEYYKGDVEGFENFEVSKYTGHHGELFKDAEEPLEISMRLDGDQVNISTNIYKDDGVNGEAYRMIAPLVKEYLKLKDENRNIARNVA